MKRLFYLLAIFSTILFYSCEKNKDSGPNNDYVNNWIYKEMSTYYLWNENLPSASSINFDSDPEKFFNFLLYRPDQYYGDRFSWIQNNYLDLLNSLSGVSSFEIGFEYIGYRESASSSNVMAQVAYVKPGTHAEQLGIKRGDVFTKVNGTQLTTSNWRNLFNASSAKVTFMSGSTTVDKTITLSKNYSENPIYLDAIYTQGAKRIGYLVYNFFAADGGDGSKKYDIQLNEVFGRFKAANITHLILDFRYNSGGSMNSATLLGSMIVPQLNTNNIFTKLQYNSIVSSAIIQKEGSDALLDKFRDKVESGRSGSVPINNVGDNLQGLYILTGGWTASASELVINNLDPYLPNINLVGDTTVGKSVGSISIYEENDSKNKWGMQPIVLRFTNKIGNANFSQGFFPKVVDQDNSLSKLPLGDENETLLAIALNMIENNGTYVRSSVQQSVRPTAIPIGSSVEKKAWANHVVVDLDRVKINE